MLPLSERYEAYVSPVLWQCRISCGGRPRLEMYLGMVLGSLILKRGYGALGCKVSRVRNANG